jgi:hypothetical protein
MLFLIPAPDEGRGRDDNPPLSVPTERRYLVWGPKAIDLSFSGRLGKRGGGGAAAVRNLALSGIHLLPPREDRVAGQSGK